MNRKPEMEVWSLPPLTSSNGYDLYSIKTKIVSTIKPNQDDVSAAIFYRIPIVNDEETKSKLKSHVITQLPEYMPFSIEELRWMKYTKHKSQNFEANNPSYCELTKNSKYSLFKNMGDPFINASFEVTDRNKFETWHKNLMTTAYDDTFKGMNIQQGYIGSDMNTPGKFNVNGTSSTNNFQTTNPFFKPSNSLNTMNNSNQFNNNQATTNFQNNNSNSVNPSVNKYNHQQNYSLNSFNTGQNFQNNDKNFDLFNENTNNNNRPNQFGFNQPGPNNTNNNINGFQSSNVNNMNNNTNFPISNSQTTAMKPPNNFNFNTNNNFQNQLTNRNNNDNQFQFNQNYSNHNNQYNANNNLAGVNGNFNSSNNNYYNFPVGQNYTSQSQNGINYVNNKFESNSSFHNKTDINKFLSNSIQNFMQYDDVINFLNDGKKENILMKMNNNYLHSKLVDTSEIRFKTRSHVVNLNEYKPNHYFIPKEITNPEGRRMLRNLNEGKKVEPINTKKVTESQAFFSQGQFPSNHPKFVIPPKEPTTLNEKYDNFLIKNKERTNFKEKIGALKTNHKIIQNNIKNPFLVPVLTNLQVKFENKNNIKEDLIDIKHTQSGNFYKLMTEFDLPISISFTYKTQNLLSIAKLKSKLIYYLNSLPDFVNIEINPCDIGFCIGGMMLMKDIGVFDLDNIRYERVDNTPVSNISNSQIIDRNEKKNLKLVKIKAMFTPEIINRYYQIKAITTEMNNQTEIRNNLINSQSRLAKNSHYFPIFTRDLKIRPFIEELRNMSESKLTKLNSFSVGNSYGKIIYDDDTVDITYTNLDAFVFKENYFEFDESDETTTLKLNKKAKLYFYNVKLSIGENSEVEYLEYLNDICRKMKVTLILTI